MLSKLMLLKFVFFLYDHLQVGSYRNIYCDTGKSKLFTHNLLLTIKIRSALQRPKPKKLQMKWHSKKSSRVFSIQFLNQTWSALGNDNGNSILSLKIQLRTKDVLVKWNVSLLNHVFSYWYFSWVWHGTRRIHKLRKVY